MPVIAPAADPMNRAFAQSGQTSRPVIVFWRGSLTRRPQSGHSRPDKPMSTSVIGQPGAYDHRARTG